MIPSTVPSGYGGFRRSLPGNPIRPPPADRLPRLFTLGGCNSSGSPGISRHESRNGGGEGGIPAALDQAIASSHGYGQKFAGYTRHLVLFLRCEGGYEQTSFISIQIASTSTPVFSSKNDKIRLLQYSWAFGWNQSTNAVAPDHMPARNTEPSLFLK